MIGFEITVNHIVFYHTATFWILSHDVQRPPIALQNITIMTHQHHLHHAPGHCIRTSTSHQHHPHQNHNLIIMARIKQTCRVTTGGKAPHKPLARTMSLQPARQVFVPKNPFSTNMLKLFMDEESADVVFQVGGQQGTATNKRAKTSPTNFHAHRLVLRQCAPQLWQMCLGARGEVPINDITLEIFRHLLHYIYGGTVEDEELEESAKDIINAANRTGVVSLKMEAEAYYI